MKTAIFALCILLLAGIANAQQQVNLTAAPASAYLPDGSTVPMWGYSCGAAVTNSTATCASLRPGTTGWSPVIITVPSGQDLTINLTNNLPAPVPTSLTIVGQIGGGLGDLTQRTTSPAPVHDNQPTTWTAANAGGVFTPPAQGPRVQSFASEVATGATSGLTWKAPRAGTYLLESGTHPSIQGPMGLYGIVVVTDAADGLAYPKVSYSADVPVLLSEIDPVQNAAVAKAVSTPGFSESAVSGPWEGGPIVSINITSGGAGYTSAPTVTLKSNPSGGGAASAVIDTDPNSSTFGQVIAINIDAPGSYSVAPIVSIDGGNGTGATAVAALQLNPNSVAHCGGAPACYPPAVNYTPLYYLINGSAFDKTNPSASLLVATATSGTATSTSNTVSGGVLVRLVNAGLRMHVPAIVGSATGTASSPGMALIAEDGNPLPGVARVQSEVFMAAGKTYDVMINAPAGSGNALPIFDRELSLSGNASSRDAGMLAYIAVNGASLPTDGAFANNAAVARDDVYASLVAGKTLTISDPSKGLIANDTNVSGVQVLAAPTGGQLTLNANGTFTYVPNAGTTSDSFTYCANGTVDLTKTQPCSSGLVATVTLGAAPIEGGSGITVADDSYNSNLGHLLIVRAPGVLANDSDAAGYPLTLDVASIAAQDGLTIKADPSGAFTATLGKNSQGVASQPGSYTFTYKARNSQGTQSASAATVTISFPKPSGLAVTLVDGMSKAALPNGANGNQDYRWVIEEDKTFYVDPNVALAGNKSTSGGNSINSFGTAFNTSYMPLVAQGCTGDNSCELGQTMLDNNPSSPTYGQHVNAICDVGSGACRPADATQSAKTVVLPADTMLDTTKRYYISVLPGDADDPTIDSTKSGHAMGGSEIVWNGTAWVTSPNPNNQLILEPTPLPPAKVSVFVYEDDFPLNGENSSGGGIDILAPNEPGLSSFNITIFDDVGQSGDSVGQLTYDMFNQPLSNSLAGTKDPLTGADACPISQQVTDSVTTGDGSQKGITGVIPVCPKYESDGATLSPLAGQAVVANLPPGRYGIVATPGADRIARGEEWLQTNTLDGQKAHDAFIRVSEPGYFQEYGPAGYHVAIGFANPQIINNRWSSICAGITAADPTNTCSHTVTGRITGVHMSRTPDERLYSTGSRDIYNFTQCYVSLGSADGADFRFAKCDADGNFTLPGVPNGDWRISIFDQWNDQVIDGYATPLTVSGGDLNMGDVAVHQWKANLYTRTFVDLNGDGKSQDNEPGLALVVTNVRYRDGSFSNLNNTDLNGYAVYNEVFPLFNWYVVETDTTRYKNTGTHVVYDVGGPVDTKGIGQNLANTNEPFPLPVDLRIPGAIYCKDADCSNESIQQGFYYSPTGGTSGDPAASSTGRIDPPYFDSYGWQGYSGQANYLEFGKKPFKEADPSTGAPAENGGIHGDVIYASTRPFDDPSMLLQNFWMPQVPHVTINLYQEGTAPDGSTSLKLVDTTQTTSWDDWAQGFHTGPDGVTQIPNMNCPGQDPKDPFYFTIKGQQVNGQQLPHDSQYKCYDGMHNWNQLQPAPYDGMYRFPSVITRDPQTGRPLTTNCTNCITNPDDGNPMLPSGKYVVEMITPQGYELVKEEDKNLLNGDAYTAPATAQIAGFGNIFIMPDQAAVGASYNPNNAQNPTTDFTNTPRTEGDTGSIEEKWPCVGEARIVPDYLSLYPQQQLVAPFAGALRNLCDRKEVRLEDQRSVLAKFYVFTSAHIAAHLTGVISDDFSAEFDPFAPAFGEKFSPPNLPVSIKDWAGNEINRVYSDQWGLYNGLTYSSWGVNPPDPSGYVPQMMVTCMNDRGTGATADPLYNPGYSQFCYELSFMPGTTMYADTPVVQTTAFADGYNHPDCNYPDATPAVKEVDGDGIGPWVQSAFGAVQSINLSNGGSGYKSAPTVTITDATGTGASATATIGNGKVSAVSVSNGGRGYTSTPSVTFGAPASGTTATGTAVMTNSVGSVRITNGGAGYTNAATVTFSAPPNPGVRATGTVNRNGGAISSVTITNPGSGYTGTATVTFSAPTGLGTKVQATGTVTMGESVASVNISNGGSGYTSAPTVTFGAAPSGGARATGSTSVTFSVTGVTLTATGGGYTNPTVGFSGGSGSGAAATATLSSGGTLTMTALGDQSVDNNAFSGPSATMAPFSTRTITRHYNFGTAQGSVTIGGKNATVTHWDANSITVQVPNGVANCAKQQQAQYGGSTAQCGELVITSANGRQSIDAVTVTIGGKKPSVMTSGQSIQSAIDQASPGDLIIVPAGYYSEMVIMWKPVRLQGVGAPSSIINADPHPSGKLDPWRHQVSCLFGLAINGQPMTGNGANGGSNPYDPTYDPVAGTGLSCPGTGWNYFVGQAVDPSKPGSGIPQVDRIPLEGIVGWDTTVNGNLAELLQEPSLMGAYEGAAITVLAKGVDTHGQADPYGQTGGAAGAFPTGTTLLKTVPGLTDSTGTYAYSDHCSDAVNPYPSNYECNPSSIDGLMLTNSSQGGGGIFVHGWAHNMQIANNRIQNNSGTLTGGITLGQGETPDAYISNTTELDPWSCVNDPTLPAGTQLPFCLDTNVNVHNNYVSQNASTGDELFSATPAGAGGVSICSGSDYYKFNYNWVCGNLSNSDGGGLSHMGFAWNGDIEHNTIIFNQSTNPTVPTNGGGVVIMGAAPDGNINGTECGNDPNDTDCPPGLSDGTGPGLVINANLIQGNAADSGSGGGIRLQGVNGTEVSRFPNAPQNWYQVNLTNNIIVNNVAGWDGAGIALNDALRVNIVNNTIASNDSTAASGTLFQAFRSVQGLTSAPGPNSIAGVCDSSTATNCTASQRQAAGLSIAQNSSQLTSSFTSPLTCPAGEPNCAAISFPILYNNIFWQNRSFHIELGGTPDPLFGQNVVTLVPTLNQNATGQCASGAIYWDLGIRGDVYDINNGAGHQSGYTLNPLHSVLTNTSGYDGSNMSSNPNVVSQYCNGSKMPPENGNALAGYVTPPGTDEGNVYTNHYFGLTPGATVDESNNWIQIKWGPLALVNPVDPTKGALGNYAPQANSPVVDAVAPGSAAYNLAEQIAPYDFFGNPRPDKTGTQIDIGAVETAGSADPEATVNPTSLTFGQTLVGTSSTAQTVTIGNSAAADGTLNYGAVSFSGPFSRSGGSCNPAGGTLTVGNSCTIQVIFTPTVRGAASGTLTVSTNDHATPTISVTLSGTGAARSASVSPASLNFGTWATSTTSSAQTLTVTNTGDFALNGGSFTFGGGSGQFAHAASGGTCGTTLAVGASCTYNVVFQPTVTGAISRTLTIAYNAGTTVTNSPVSLNGTGATFAVTPAAVAFGNQVVNTSSAAQTLTVRNSTTVNRALTITLSGPFSRTTGTTNCGATLAANTSCNIYVVFTPTALGGATGSVTVAAGGTPAVTVANSPVSLTGTGVAVVNSASLTPATWSPSATRGVGILGPIQAFTLTNTGNVNLTGVAAGALSGTNTADFAVVALLSNCGNATHTTLAPGATCTVTVQFRPQTSEATGTKNATLTVNTTSAGAQTSALTGTAN